MTSALIVADIGGTKIALGHLEQPLTGALSTVPNQHLQTVATDLLRVANPVFALENILLEYAKTHNLSPTAIVLGVPVSLAKDLDTVLSSPNISQLEGLLAQGHRTLVPLALYFLGHHIKVELGIGLARKKGDRREIEKEKEARKQMRGIEGRERRGRE